MPSCPRNAELARYPLRTEAVMTLQGIEAACSIVFEELLASTAHRGLEPEEDELAVLDAIDQCDHIALAASTLKGRLRAAGGYE